MDHEYWLDQFHNIVLRKGPLVYIPTLKNACSYYRSVCVHNGWSIIKWAEIDWSRDHVFSFISDPIRRYFKGLAQDIFNIYYEEDKAVFYELLKYSTKTFKDTALVLTFHTLPLYTIYNNYVDLIDWIPIHESCNHTELFVKLCNSYNIEINLKLEGIDENKSTPQQINFFTELINNANKLENNIFYNILLAKDIELFKKVLENFNPAGNTWQEISWLNKYVTNT